MHATSRSTWTNATDSPGTFMSNRTKKRIVQDVVWEKRSVFKFVRTHSHTHTPHLRGSIYRLHLLSPVQTDATLLANNSQHFWMLHVAFVCIPSALLGVVASVCTQPWDFVNPSQVLKKRWLCLVPVRRFPRPSRSIHSPGPRGLKHFSSAK